jgi:hypothetical protein
MSTTRWSGRLRVASLIWNTLALGDFGANGAIGTAAATVDNFPAFAIAQTSGGGARALTLPNPTTTTQGRVAIVRNAGTAAFTVQGVNIPVGETRSFFWTGAAWVLWT